MKVSLNVVPFTAFEYECVTDNTPYSMLDVLPSFVLLGDGPEIDHDKSSVVVAIMTDDGDDVEQSAEVSLSKLDEAIIARCMMQGGADYQYHEGLIEVDFGSFDVDDYDWIVQMAAFNDIIVG